MLPHFEFAESLTNLSSEILSCSTVYFRFSVTAGGNLMEIYRNSLKKPLLAKICRFLDFSGNTENLNCYDFEIIILILTVQNHATLVTAKS